MKSRRLPIPCPWNRYDRRTGVNRVKEYKEAASEAATMVQRANAKLLEEQRENTAELARLEEVARAAPFKVEVI